MSAETSNDPFAAILDRYGPVQAAPALSQRLTTTEIAQLAYPEDDYGNDRLTMVTRLHKAIDRGDLAACGTAAPPAYLTPQGVKHGPRPPLVDRAEFARFLTALGTAPSGRLAEWIAQPDGSPPQPVSAGRPGRPSTNAEAYELIKTLMAAGSDQGTACLDAVREYFPEAADAHAKAKSLEGGLRYHRNKPKGSS